MAFYTFAISKGIN